MGCLKFIIKVVIVILAVIGFRSLGGWDWCVKTFHIGEKVAGKAEESIRPTQKLSTTVHASPT